jgi:hypothetical protein
MNRPDAINASRAGTNSIPSFLSAFAPDTVAGFPSREATDRMSESNNAMNLIKKFGAWPCWLTPPVQDLAHLEHRECFGDRRETLT